METLTAMTEVDGKDLKLKGYYSCNDRAWCFVLPAGHQDAELAIEAVSSKGDHKGIGRKNGEKTIEFEWKDRIYTIDFLCDDSIHTLYVTLDKGKEIQDVWKNKTKKFSGVLMVLDPEGNLSSESLCGFHGHGNDSWAAEKKSYNLRLERAFDLLGMGENEDFALLACYRDNSLMNYCITTEFIRELGFEYSPEFRLVNLYVGGEYEGIYFLAEKVELDKNRIELESVYEKTKEINFKKLKHFPMEEWKDEKSSAERYYYRVAKNPEDLTGGYLLEMDICDYEPDESRFVSKRGIPITLKRAKYSSEEAVTYLAEFWQEFEDALFSEDGKNEEGRHYTEYIDTESFAMQWMLYELVQERSMSNSIYIYKESEVTGDGLLHACFPWDMEHSYLMSAQVGELWNITEKAETLHGYWKAFYSHEDFRKELQRVWNEKFLPAIQVMISEEAQVTPAGMRNLRWYEERIVDLDRLENSRWYKMHPLKRCQSVREFLKIRRDALTVYMNGQNL